jgi:hypothetical protein
VIPSCNNTGNPPKICMGMRAGRWRELSAQTRSLFTLHLANKDAAGGKHNQGLKDDARL